MAGAIPQSFIDTVLERTDLAALLRERMTLKKAGATLTGCCPFHDEKTPSFHVYHQTHPQHYHCFGCGAHGDAIALLRELDHLSFVDAIEALARRAGMEVPQDEDARRQMDERRPLYEVLAQAQQLYQQQLMDSAGGAAARYLEKRGVRADMADLFGLGEAPADRHFLVRRLNPSLQPAAEQVRLLVRRERDVFDLFSHRLMFPIRNTRGRVVGFGGRTLGDDRSKYMNSPESPVFHKSQVLYGLWENRQRFRHLDQLIVVEGYLDVIALVQHDIPGAVATMGTATNEENLSQLLSHSRSLVFCFDGDAAGLKAADKAVENILPLLRDGDQIRFLLLPEGDDPDTLVRRAGREAFLALLEQARPLSTFLFDRLADGLDLAVPEQRAEFNRRGREALSRMKDNRDAPVLRNGLWDALKQRVREAEQRGWLRRRRGTSTQWTDRGGTAMQGAVPARRIRIPARLMYALTRSPELVSELEPLLALELENEEDRALQRIVKWLTAQSIRTSEALFYALATRPRLRDAWKKLLGDTSWADGLALDWRSEVQGALAWYERRYLEATVRSLKQQMAERPEDKTLFERLMRAQKTLHDRRARSSTPG